MSYKFSGSIKIIGGFNSIVYPSDPYEANVSLLIKPSDSNNLTDITGKPLTYIGNAFVNNQGINLDGSGDGITTANNTLWNVKPAITVEVLLTANTLSAYNVALGKWQESNYTTSSWVLETVGNDWYIYFAYNSALTSIRAAGKANIGIRQHVAFVYQNNSLSLFVDGIKYGPVSAPNINSNTFPLYIGSIMNAAGNGITGSWNGIIHSVRITSGVARYTENFISPVSF